MRVTIRWQSTYEYSEPVRLLHTELRVLPADGFGQHRVSGDLTLTPAALPIELHDTFRNSYHHVDFLEEVEEVRVAFSAEVETADAPTATPLPSPLLRHLYLSPTTRAPFHEAVSTFIEAIPGGLDPVATGQAICDEIHRRFVFEVGSTDVAATALDLLTVGRGVCQDFSHLALAALRLRGVPARYVSGYLAPEEGHEEGEASHAWVQLFDGDRWHGLDPANDIAQDGRYVVTAVGRDYDDVPPLRGTFAGVAVETWTTTLRIHSATQQ